ncbi:unnamed protein product, partial [Ixodes persulcatus]
EEFAHAQKSVSQKQKIKEKKEGAGANDKTTRFNSVSFVRYRVFSSFVAFDCVAKRRSCISETKKKSMRARGIRLSRVQSYENLVFLLFRFSGRRE